LVSANFFEAFCTLIIMFCRRKQGRDKFGLSSALRFSLRMMSLHRDKVLVLDEI
jgi:hypothetical protein